MKRKLGQTLGLALIGGLVIAWAVNAYVRPDELRWIEVERGELLIATDVTGELEAVSSSVLGPPQIPQMWNFKITYMAPEGEPVEAGEPVLRFDPSELEKLLEEKQSKKASAEKSLEKLETDLELQDERNQLALAEARAKLRLARLKVQAPQDAIAAQELQLAQLDLQLAEQQVAYLESSNQRRLRLARIEKQGLREQMERAAARVEEIESYLERLEVPAPRSGIVIYVKDWEGNKHKVGDSVWRSERILQVPDLKLMKGRGEVEEFDSGRVEPGQQVTLRLDAHPDIEYSGTIGSVGRTVQPKSDNDPTMIVGLEIRLDATDQERMRPGMRFRGKVELQRVPNALLVPLDAIRPTSRGPLVRRATSLGAEIVSPELGRRGAETVEVLGGLSPGDRVSLPPPEIREDGS